MPHFGSRFQVLFALCGQIANFPRHLGSHSSGIVIGRVPLDTIAPLSPSARGVVPIWTLDKDDCEEVGAIKFDILSLRTLAAVSRCGDRHPPAQRAIQVRSHPA